MVMDALGDSTSTLALRASGGGSSTMSRRPSSAVDVEGALRTGEVFYNSALQSRDTEDGPVTPKNMGAGA